MPPSHFERELNEQPAVFRRLLAEGRAQAEDVAAQISAFAPSFCVIAARGSSDNAARYAQYLLGAHNRLSVGLAAPSLFTQYAMPPSLRGALVIGISQSGHSPDIVQVLASANDQGAFTLALTNVETSRLASTARACLPLRAGVEKSIAATKTYSAELVALAMLSASLGRSPQRWAELDQLAGWAETTLRAGTPSPSQVAPFIDSERFVVLSRGFNLATAFELALKVKETSYVHAEPYSWADFLHGPVALLEPGLPVLLVAPRGALSTDLVGVVDRIEAAQAELVVISDDEALLARATVALPLPAGVPEHLAPAVAILPGQRFALALAQARGLDPDAPRGLRKVTETR